MVGCSRRVDVLGVSGDGDARVLRAGYLDRGVLGQFGYDGVGVGVDSAVQVLHDLRDADMGGLYPRRRLVHQHHPHIMLR